MRLIDLVAVALAGMASTTTFANAGSWLASSHAVAGRAACHWEVQNV
jgi:hypothetical protein